MSNESDQMEICDEPVENPYKKIKCEPEENVRTPEGGYKVKTYYPTLDEMKDFSKFMKRVHDDGGHKAGLAKIIPPHNYKPRKSGYDDESLYEMKIPHPIKQEVNGKGGLYQQLNVVQKRKMSVRNFKRMAEEKHPTPEHEDGELERTFWKTIFMNPSWYGADVPGSLFDPDCEHFNLTRLNTIIDDIKHDYGVTIEGVNTTYLYFGMWKSSFCWHTEDVDLYSINYLHAGAPKAWYCIAPEYGKRFERLAAGLFPHLHKNCRAFLRHKTSLISPAILKKHSIPFSKATQRAGEFMVTFPYSYHSGYNHGYNIAEATNFALEYWIEFGKWATKCECSSESVKISMQTFVKKYQADRYTDWIRGRDIGPDPRDPKHRGPAPKPSDQDLFVMGVHERSEADIEEEQKVALQQNLSCNVTKSKSKKVKKVKTDHSIYEEYLKAHDSLSYQGSTNLPSFPIPPASFTEDLDQQHVGLNRQQDSTGIFSATDLNNKLIKALKKSDLKKEEISHKISQKKEKRAKERILLSQELLHYLPTSFTQEKKFNRCIAAQPPHCSVCQLTVPHPKDDETIWGPRIDKDIKQTVTSDQQTSQNPDSQETLIGSGTQQNPTSSFLLPSITGSQNVEFKLPEFSNLLLPRITFGRTERNLENQEVDPLEDARACLVTDIREGDSGYGDFLEIDLDKPAELIQCTVCMLAVHRICYGLDKLIQNKDDWICDRCMEPNRANIGCALCPCRGGALKKFQETWAHISCALTLNRVSHADLMFKKDFKLPELSDKKTCVHCKENMKLAKYVQGHTIKCVGIQGIDGPYGCTNTFHPTCGHRNGALFEALDFHIKYAKQNDDLNEQLIKAQCSECATKTTLIPANAYLGATRRDHSDLDAIGKGTQVIVQTRKGNLINAIVEDHKPFMVYDIFYPELSTVEVGVAERNLVPGDRSKELRLGDEIRVKAQKGDRVGKVKEKYLNEVEYVIKPLRSTHTERVNRSDIYLNIDQLSESQLEIYVKEMKFKSTDNPSSQ